MKNDTAKYTASSLRAARELNALEKALKAAVASGIIAEVAKVARALQGFEDKYPLDVAKKFVARQADKVVQDMTSAHTYKYKTQAGHNANCPQADFNKCSNAVTEVAAKFAHDVDAIMNMHKGLKRDVASKLKALREPLSV